VFRIGEFSRLAQLSVRVLRHYHEIGLLRPAHTDPANDYRYYTIEQLGDVNRIVALKDLGLSLAQIHKLMQERLSTAELVGILRVEVARAEQARADAERRLRGLEHRLAEIADTGAMSGIHIIEKSVPAMPFLALRVTVGDLDEARALVTEVLAAGSEGQRAEPITIVAYDRFFDTERLDIEIGYTTATARTLTLPSGQRLTSDELPAVERMISIVYSGDPSTGHRRCHHALGLWLSAHNCHLAGPGREILHEPTGTTFEIQYPITSGADRPPDLLGRDASDGDS
jgi:DNA-binding transcriptional MerR regulator